MCRKSVGFRLFFWEGEGERERMEGLQKRNSFILFSRIVSVVAFWQKSESTSHHEVLVPLNLGNCRLSFRVACGSLKGHGDG